LRCRPGSLKLTRLFVATHAASRFPGGLVFRLFSRNLRNMQRCSPSLSSRGGLSLSWRSFWLWLLPPSRRLDRVPPTPFVTTMSNRYLANLHLLRVRCNEKNSSPGRRGSRLDLCPHIRLVICADVMVAITAALPASPPVSAFNALSSVGASLFGLARFAGSKALVMRRHLVPP
jgi:hypothetical protein